MPCPKAEYVRQPESWRLQCGRNKVNSHIVWFGLRESMWIDWAMKARRWLGNIHFAWRGRCLHTSCIDQPRVTKILYKNMCAAHASLCMRIVGIWYVNIFVALLISCSRKLFVGKHGPLAMGYFAIESKRSYLHAYVQLFHEIHWNTLILYLGLACWANISHVGFMQFAKLIFLKKFEEKDHGIVWRILC